MRAVNIVTLLLVIIGGINWGLMGLFQFDLVASIFGGPSAAMARPRRPGKLMLSGVNDV